MPSGHIERKVKLIKRDGTAFTVFWHGFPIRISRGCRSNGSGGRWQSPIVLRWTNGLFGHAMLSH